MRLINANKLEADMYHEAFEITTDFQKWDSGCWIRYKMFENVMDKQPTVKAITVEWIIDWLTKQTIPALHTCDDYRAVEKMLDDWEAENEAD